MARNFLLIFSVAWTTLALAKSFDRDELQNSIEKAQRFLSNKEVIAEIGSLFMTQRLSPNQFDQSDVPAHDAFNRLFGATFTIPDLTLTRTIKSELVLRGIPRLRPLNNYFYILPEKYKKTVHDPWDDILIKALYCDNTGFDDLDFAIVSAVRDFGGGYYDTHQLLALFMLEENRCYDQGKIERAKQEIVRDVINALKADGTFSDLYAERVACLYWAGAGNRVDPKWIRLIKDAQQDDGGWADIGSTISGSHPTGLAALSLKYFLNPHELPYFYKR